MHSDEARSRQYAIVAKAIAYIRAHAGAQPSLAQIADAVHLSPHHLQRVFAAWAGISPKRFLQYLTKEYARAQLAASADLLEVSAAAGLGSGSRLHELMVSCEAMTPGEIKAGAHGIDIGYGIAPTPFGPALVAWTGRGVCHFAFREGAEEAMLAELTAQWPHARLHEDQPQARALMARIFPDTPTPGRVHLVLRGTNFQIKVWEALMRVEPGRLVSYSQFARSLGMPQAPRTVGSAIAANTIAALIPCHRVIREGGEAGHYRWGDERKLAMIGWEAARAQAAEADAGASEAPGAS